MKILFGGVRGTSSRAQSGFMRYGGETTSVLVLGEGGEHVILDAGTGLSTLGHRLKKKPPQNLLLLLTHFHLDHVMGWPSFPLLYQPGVTLHVAVPRRFGGRKKARHILSQLMHQPFWPVQIDRVKATLRFLEVPRHYGRLDIRWCPVHHPGGCAAYRLDEPTTGHSMVFATDVEWGRASDRERRQFLRLCREPSPCRLLLFDGQYARRNYSAVTGWGHSTWEDAVEVARATGARRLLVIHHAPDRDDGQLACVEHRLAAALPGARLARGGRQVEP